MEYTEDQLTEWFDIDKHNPLEPGVYFGKFDDGQEMYSHWNGDSFSGGWRTKERALSHSNEFFRSDAHSQPIKWRGLSSEPAKPKKRENKRKTMYVVMQHQEGFKSHPLASFEDKKIADKRALWFKKNITFAYHPATYSVETVRFRVD